MGIPYASDCDGHKGTITHVIYMLDRIAKAEPYARYRPSKYRNGKRTPGRIRYDQDPGAQQLAYLSQPARIDVPPNARRLISALPCRPVRRIIAHSSGGAPG